MAHANRALPGGLAGVVFTSIALFSQRTSKKTDTAEATPPAPAAPPPVCAVPSPFAAKACGLERELPINTNSTPIPVLSTLAAHSEPGFSVYPFFPLLLLAATACSTYTLPRLRAILDAISTAYSYMSGFSVILSTLCPSLAADLPTIVVLLSVLLGLATAVKPTSEPELEALPETVSLEDYNKLAKQRSQLELEGERTQQHHLRELKATTDKLDESIVARRVLVDEKISLAEEVARQAQEVSSLKQQVADCDEKIKDDELRTGELNDELDRFYTDSRNRQGQIDGLRAEKKRLEAAPTQAKAVARVLFGVFRGQVVQLKQQRESYKELEAMYVSAKNELSNAQREIERSKLKPDKLDHIVSSQNVPQSAFSFQCTGFPVSTSFIDTTSSSPADPASEATSTSASHETSSSPAGPGSEATSKMIAPSASSTVPEYDRDDRLPDPRKEKKGPGDRGEQDGDDDKPIFFAPPPCNELVPSAGYVPSFSRPIATWSTITQSMQQATNQVAETTHSELEREQTPQVDQTPDSTVDTVAEAPSIALQPAHSCDLTKTKAQEERSGEKSREQSMQSAAHAFDQTDEKLHIVKSVPNEDTSMVHTERCQAAVDEDIASVHTASETQLAPQFIVTAAVQAKAETHSLGKPAIEEVQAEHLNAEAAQTDLKPSESSTMPGDTQGTGLESFSIEPGTAKDDMTSLFNSDEVSTVPSDGFVEQTQSTASFPSNAGGTGNMNSGSLLSKPLAFTGPVAKSGQASTSRVRRTPAKSKTGGRMDHKQTIAPKPQSASSLYESALPSTSFAFIMPLVGGQKTDVRTDPAVTAATRSQAEDIDMKDADSSSSASGGDTMLDLASPSAQATIQALLQSGLTNVSLLNQNAEQESSLPKALQVKLNGICAEIRSGTAQSSSSGGVGREDTAMGGSNEFGDTSSGVTASATPCSTQRIPEVSAQNQHSNALGVDTDMDDAEVPDRVITKAPLFNAGPIMYEPTARTPSDLETAVRVASDKAHEMYRLHAQHDPDAREQPFKWSESTGELEDRGVFTNKLRIAESWQEYDAELVSLQIVDDKISGKIRDALPAGPDGAKVRDVATPENALTVVTPLEITPAEPPASNPKQAMKAAHDRTIALYKQHILEVSGGRPDLQKWYDEIDSAEKSEPDAKAFPKKLYERRLVFMQKEYERIGRDIQRSLDSVMDELDEELGHDDGNPNDDLERIAEEPSAGPEAQEMTFTSQELKQALVNARKTNLQLLSEHNRLDGFSAKASDWKKEMANIDHCVKNADPAEADPNLELVTDEDYVVDLRAFLERETQVTSSMRSDITVLQNSESNLDPALR